MSDTGCPCQACLSGAGACGCCEGVDTVTPRPIANRPGLPRLAARIGTHGDFLESMQARLSTHTLQDGGRPMLALGTRDRADPGIALLDAFAVVGDVLTFYQERAANEGYLRTATRDRSVRELARLIGYEPSPGVSASTFLAFTLDSDPETPITIPAGTGAKSLPGQDELPQVFETSRDLVARTRWNTLGLRHSEPERGDVRDESGRFTDIFLDGTDTGLKPGDALLFEWGEPPDWRQAYRVPVRVLTVAPDLEAKRTAVMVEAWVPGTYVGPPHAEPSPGVIGDEFTAADRVLLTGLREQAPGGAIASGLVARLDSFEAAEPSERAALRIELARDIRAARRRIGRLPQRPLRGWLDKVERSFPGHADVAFAPAASTSTGSDANEGEAADQRPTWLEALAAPASAAPRSSEQLARSTGRSFAKGSDAAYRTLAVALPAVGKVIGAALSGTRGAAPALDFRVHAFRARTGVFGRTFPKRTATQRLTDNAFLTGEIGEWPLFAREAAIEGSGQIRYLERGDRVMLDTVQDGIVPGSWVMIDMAAVDRPDEGRWVVDRADDVVLTQAAAVTPRLARADYGGSAEGTMIQLGAKDQWLTFNTEADDPEYDQALIDRDFQLIRRTTVYARTELLPLAPRPIAGGFCVHPDSEGPLPWVELDGAYVGLEPGRYVAITGERADIAGVEGVPASEVAMIAEVVHGVRSTQGEPVPPGDAAAAVGDGVHTFLRFANALAYCYRRETLVLQANVVKATHGETQREVLGNGDAAAARQSFALKRSPLTYTPAATAAGAEAALDVYVDDIRWRGAANLVATGPQERVYAVRNDAGGKAMVIFADGRDGARPPTGTQNIRAVYRAGLGRPGNLGAGRLEQLVTRPLGLRGVTNPVAATGGADAEPREQTRRNAPISTMALDRLVSLRDHEDFACSFAGIARATAQAMPSGSRRILHLTIAAEDDAPLDPAGELILNLRAAFRRLGDPGLPVIVAPRELKLLIISAKVRIDQDRVWEVVAQAIRGRLIERFGFDARELAQGLAPSAVVAAIQSVAGVAWVDLDTFGGVETMDSVVKSDGEEARLPSTPDEIAERVAEVAAAGVARWVSARPARAGDGEWPIILPAELLLLSPDVPATLVLNQIK